MRPAIAIYRKSGELSRDDPLTVIAATEAIIGLLIAVSFIAIFTQRFFSS